MLSIILYLWGKEGPAHRYSGLFEYSPAYVAAMAAGIRQNIKMPHEIVVVSDYPAHEFDSSLRYVSLQEHFAAERLMGQCFLRLKGFRADMADILGERCAWIDLDSVICGPLDPLFDVPAPLKLLKLDSVQGTPWNGSVVLWSPRETDWLWQGFDRAVSPKEARELGFKGSDQAYLSMRCGPLTPHWDYRDGILHYDLHCGRRKPEHAKIITWPGRAKPGTSHVRRNTRWLDDLLDAQRPFAPIDAKPWPITPQKPMFAKQRPGRPTMQDLRREARAKAMLAGQR
jgi:hypothetical protein